MMRYNSVKIEGRDYSKPLKDLMPEIIGKRAKTTTQIAKIAGRERQTTEKVVKRLHQNGEIHIRRWSRGNNGPYVPHFFWGKGKDAPKPIPLTNSEKTKRYRMTEKGRAVARACRARWIKSERGEEYRSNYSKARWAREKLAKGGIAAIDPILAAILGVSRSIVPPNDTPFIDGADGADRNTAETIQHPACCE
jgi:hypothetical protein